MEFWAKLEGSRKHMNRLTREAWERTRELVYTVAQFSGNLKKGATKYDLMLFEWDERKNRSRIAQLSGEERKEAARRLIEERQAKLTAFLNQRKN